MAELINLIMVGVAIASIVVAIGSRDRIRTLEFRLALIERRIRERQAESTATPRTTPDLDLPAEPESSIVPEPPAPPVASEPDSPDAALPPPGATEPASPPSAAAVARPRPSIEERFGTQWVVWAGGIAGACGGFFMLRLSIEQGWFGPGTRVSLGEIGRAHV